MIRIVIQETDFGNAANIGGPVETRIKTFDVELPEVEKHLHAAEKAKEEKRQCWFSRQVIGVEVLP